MASFVLLTCLLDFIDKIRLPCSFIEASEIKNIDVSSEISSNGLIQNKILKASPILISPSWYFLIPSYSPSRIEKSPYILS